MTVVATERKGALKLFDDRSRAPVIVVVDNDDADPSSTGGSVGYGLQRAEQHPQRIVAPEGADSYHDLWQFVHAIPGRGGPWLIDIMSVR